MAVFTLILVGAVAIGFIAYVTEDDEKTRKRLAAKRRVKRNKENNEEYSDEDFLLFMSDE